MQRRTAQAISEGRDVIVTAETGSGKTLAFLMPVLARLTYPTGVDDEMEACLPTYRHALSVCSSSAIAVVSSDITKHSCASRCKLLAVEERRHNLGSCRC